MLTHVHKYMLTHVQRCTCMQHTNTHTYTHTHTHMKRSQDLSALHCGKATQLPSLKKKLPGSSGLNMASVPAPSLPPIATVLPKGKAPVSQSSQITHPLLQEAFLIAAPRLRIPKFRLHCLSSTQQESACLSVFSHSPWTSSSYWCCGVTVPSSPASEALHSSCTSQAATLS